MSTTFFSLDQLAKAVVYLDVSIDDVLAFSRANAKAFNKGRSRSSDAARAPSAAVLQSLADEYAGQTTPTIGNVLYLLESVGLFRYNVDDFEDECDEALTRIEAKAFRLTRYLDTIGACGLGDDYRERRESERAR